MIHDQNKFTLKHSTDKVQVHCTMAKLSCVLWPGEVKITSLLKPLGHLKWNASVIVLVLSITKLCVLHWSGIQELTPQDLDREEPYCKLFCLDHPEFDSVLSHDCKFDIFHFIGAHQRRLLLLFTIKEFKRLM